MTLRHLALLLALYVSLDLANPFMPGAFRLDPDESVDGIGGFQAVARPRLVAVAPVPDRYPSAAVRDRVSRSGPDRVVREWLAETKQGYARPPEPSRTADDH
jgi:hypothetical protein